jgi:glycosyltransferase involved in cell wall biosynthesis
VRVAVVSEFYPRARDPVLGIWAHRQAVAARDAGAEVRVLVLHRPIPPRAEPGKLRALAELARQPRHAELDGLEIEYVPFVAPPRPRTYGSWGAWAAPTLRLALGRLRRRWPHDLVHAHNAIPAGAAVGDTGLPLVVSVHGGDVYFTAPRHGAERVRRVFARSALVLANSAGVQERARALGAPRTRVVHLGTDVPEPEPAHERGTLVTLGHLVARKGHADVLRALPELPGRRYVIIGDGPERGALQRLAAELGVANRVEFTGQLPPAEALARARACEVFVMPSTDEAFGVAYVEAMAGGLPAVGRAGEPGPEEIAAAGPGMYLASPRDLAAVIAAARDGAQARETVRRHFTWEACGRATVAAYEEALGR